MKSWNHAVVGAIVGAIVAVIPDVVLVTYGWRQTWLPARHPLVRAHRFLHSSRSLLLVIPLAWVSHIVADSHSHHRGAKW